MFVCLMLRKGGQEVDKNHANDGEHQTTRYRANIQKEQ